jgi:hypothetical protein
MTIIWPPLPRRTRVRLWTARRADLTASWLVCHGHWRLAMRLWQLCGMW